MSNLKQASRLVSNQLIRLDRRAVVELGVIILFALASLGGLYVGRLHPPVYHIDLAHNSDNGPLDLAGVNAIETNQAFSYTWSTGYTLVQYRHGYNAAPSFRATVRLRAANPQGPQPLTFLVNEQPVITVTPSSAFQTYDMLLPNRDTGDLSLRFAFTTKPFSPPGDTRELGVILTDITLQPLVSIRGSDAISVLVLLICLWLWLRLRQTSLAGAALICGTLAVALALIYSQYLASPISFLWLATITIAAAAYAAIIAQKTVTRLVLSALTLLFTFSGMLWTSWLTDDAFISFRYAQNLLAGQGLVYNVGERVEGYTNFLWTMLAALGMWSGADIVMLAYASGILIGLAIVFLTYWTLRELRGDTWAVLGALMVGANQSVLVYTARGSGLETGLFTLLILAGGACAMRPHLRRWYGVFFALATLTRPEGLLLMCLTLCYDLLVMSEPSAGGLRHRLLANAKTLLPIALSYTAIFIPFFLWRTIYYGDLLPNTFYAKTGGGLRAIPRGLEYTGRFILSIGGPLVLLGCASIVRDWRSALKSWRGYVFSVIGIYTCYIIAVGGDHFPGERFFVPLVPWFALVMADGIAQSIGAIQRSGRFRMAAPIVLVALTVLYLGSAVFRGPDFETIIGGDDESLGIWRELGWWFSDHSRPDETIAAMGAGAIAFYSDRTTIDLLGLNDKHIARVENDQIGTGIPGHEKRDPVYVLNVRKPTYIPQIWEEYFGGEQALSNRYSLIRIHTRYGRAMKIWRLK